MTAPKNFSTVGFKKDSPSPGWCGSMDWVPACTPKGHWLDSLPRHMPGLQARSPVGGMWEATTHWCFSPCLSPSLPLCLKIKYIKSLKKRRGGSPKQLHLGRGNERMGDPNRTRDNMEESFTECLNFLNPLPWTNPKLWNTSQEQRSWLTCSCATSSHSKQNTCQAFNK